MRGGCDLVSMRERRWFERGAFLNVPGDKREPKMKKGLQAKSLQTLLKPWWGVTDSNCRPTD
jgi:hypothetical protein